MKKIIILCVAMIAFLLDSGYAQSTANYAFTTNTTGSLALDLNSNTVDMSTGTTTLVGASNDDVSSSAVTIPFTFYLMGKTYTQISATSNGWLALGATTFGGSTYVPTSASATTPLIAAMGGDLYVSSSGKIHYKVVGSAPNRCLVVEFLNMAITYSTSSVDGTYQIRLYETTGVVEFVYGSMARGIGTLGGDSGYIGFGSGNASNLNAFITSSTNANSTTGAWAANTYAASSGAIPNLNSASNGSRRVYTYTPTAPADPTTLTFTSVGGSTTTPNWVDNSTTETSFLVTRATDPAFTANVVTGSVASTTTAGTGAAYLLAQTGLSFGTTYYYKIQAVGEIPSSGLTGSQATNTGTLSGVKTVGTGGDYNNLTTAFAAINTNGLAGNIELQLIAGYPAAAETFPLVTSSASAVGAFDVKIYPTVAGLSITGSSATGLINFNNGSKITIDGRVNQTGAKDLIISNTNTTSTAYGIQFINDAFGNTIKYCTIKSLNPSTTSGVIVFSTTTGASGNDNNTIDNCDIDGGAGATASPTLVATNGIYATGTGTTVGAPTFNNNITISNCNIFNYFNAGTNSGGIVVSSANSEWTISNNKFYQTVPRIFTTTTLVYYGIQQTSNGMNGMLISGNTIGYSSNSGTGVTNISGSSNMVHGISIFTGSVVSSTVQNNIITAITQSSSRASTAAGNGPFYGIRSGAGGLATITGNTIGSLDNSSSISLTHTTTTASTAPSAGIYTGAAFAQSIINNNIGSITLTQTATQQGALRGIHVNPSTGIVITVTGNIVGGSTTVAGLTQTNGLAQLIGIHAVLGVNNISNNTVRNLTHQGSANTGTGSSAQLIGISNNSTDAGVSTISQNTIFNINNSSTAAANTQVAGFYNNGSTTGNATISRNSIYNINSGSTGTSPLHYGMNFGGGICNVSNNMVAIGTGMTNNIGIFGINDGGTTNNFYYNSVYVGGSSSGALNTFAFNSSVTTNTRKFQNNIFFNARTNSSTGRSYAISVAGSAPNPSGLTIGNNDYWVSGTGTILGRYNSADVLTLAAWQTAVGQDVQSINIDPSFVAPTASTPDLHITSPNPSTTLESAGLNISGISVDIDGQTRPGTSSGSNSGVGSDIGADEFDGINPSLCSGTPSSGGTVAASTTTFCNTLSSINVTFTLSGASAGPGIQYQWQTSNVGANTWTDVSGAIATSTVITLTTSKDVRCVVKCAASALSANSSIITVNAVSCQFNVTRNTSTSYVSIMATGTTYTTWSGGSFPGDDEFTNTVALTGTTFKYKGTAVTGFWASTNGFISFNGALKNASSSNDLTSTSVNQILAPFWDDLVLKGGLASNHDVCMRYKINGTLGSGTADIIIEWADLERFSFGPPNINFQIVLHEADNSIDFNYATMLLYDGSTNNTSLFSYSIGLNGSNPAGTTLEDRMILQRENTAFLSTTTQNSLTLSTSCTSQLNFVPGAYTGTDPGAPGIPANNEFATAFNLVVNPAPCTSICGKIYTSLNATATPSIAVCSAVTPGTPDDDVWFSFSTTSAPSYKIDVTPSLNYNAVVQLLDATLTPINCVNAAGDGLSETMTATLASGTYYLRIYHSGTTTGSSNGEFGICISEVIPPPANDECAGATSLTVNSTCMVTNSTLPATLAATASAGIPVCSAGTPGTPDDDVWYQFTTDATVGANYVITVQGTGTYNPVLQLLSGTCGTLTAVACLNATGNGGIESYSSVALTPSTTYYVRVYHSGTGAANGNFSICVSKPLPGCPATFTPATMNSACQSTSATTLSWAAAADATTYDVYFDAGSGPATTKVSASQVGLTYNAGILTPGTYAWRVESINSNGTTICSNLTFTVIAFPTINITPAGPITICSGASQLLSLGTTNAAMPSYQWLTGTSPISGETNTTYQPTLSGSYALRVTDAITTCSNTSNVVIYTINPLPIASVTPSTASSCGGMNVNLTASSASAYCSPTFPSNPGATGDYLNNFTFANITNNGSGDAASDYTYYNTLTANLIADGTTVYNLSLEAGGISSTFAQQFRIWIDLNQNGVFEASESVFNTTTSTFSPTVVNGSVTIPTTAFNGTTRMRVISRYNATPTTTENCNSTSFGEYEDYNVSITGGVTNTVNYLWNNPVASTSPSISVLPLTTTAYTVTITDNNGCSNTASSTVTATVPPSGSTAQSFCVSSSPTIASIVATGTGLIWYDASSGGMVLPTSTPLVNGTTYYASQTISGCESNARLGVLATVTPTPSAPTGAASQAFCSSASPTVASLAATGTSIKWYDMASGGMELAPTTAMVNGTHYYASQTVGGCESTTRLDVTAAIEGTTVTSGANSGAGSLRSVVACAAENATITIDAAVTTITMTESLTLDKNLMIMDMAGANVNISFDFTTITTSGIGLAAGKTVTLMHLNVGQTNNTSMPQLPLIQVDGTLNTVDVNTSN